MPVTATRNGIAPLMGGGDKAAFRRIACLAFLALGLSPVAAWASDPSMTQPSPRPAFVPEPSAEQFRSEAGDRVFFAESSAELGARARVALEAQALWLARHPGVKLVVEGHADDPGGEEANRLLSEQRALAVRERLLKLGLSPDRVVSVGFGRAQPAAVCPQAACAAHNRRVVTQVRERRSAEGSPGQGDRPERVRPSPRRLF